MNKTSFGAGQELEELKRTARILEMVQMIAVSPRRYRRKDFADRFEISVRMVGKDIDVIRHALRLPLIPSSQGYYFEEIPHLPAVQYTIPEALAVLLAVQAAQQISGVSSPELAAAVARLESLFPPAFTPLLRRLVTRPPATAQGKHRHQMLILLNRALGEERKVRMIYRSRSSGGKSNERIVHPYHIMPYVRSWMLIAYCEKRDNVLMFKVDRIDEASLLDESYRIDPAFNPDTYMGDTWGALRGESFEPEEVVLIFNADTGSRVIEEDWHPSQQDRTLADGRIEFTLRIGITPEFVSWLMYYGRHVEVIEPESLRVAILEAHTEAIHVYDYLYHQEDSSKHA